MTKISQQRNKIRKIRRIVIFILILIVLSLFPAPNIYFLPLVKKQGISLSEEIVLPSPPLYPQKITDNQPPVLSALGVFVMDLPSGVVIYEKNSREKFLPASTTKIMTALVGLDYYKLDDILTVKTVKTGGRVMGLVKDEKISFEALLYGMLVHSANDAAYAIADNYPGGITQFVSAMNRKVREYHLEDTHFANPMGFDDDQNYSTARDLAKLAKIALNNKIFAKVVSTRSITVSDISFSYFHELKNVNELLGKVAGVAGVKTGFTQSAGEILISEVRKNGHSVLIVLLKSKDRFGETERLIDWIFANHVWQEIGKITPIVQDQ